MSHIASSTTIWEPQPDEIKVRAYPEDSPRDFPGFWYLYAARSVCFGVGRYAEHLAADAAAMRKLAAAAAELAGLLEDRLNASMVPDLKASAAPAQGISGH